MAGWRSMGNIASTTIINSEIPSRGFSRVDRQFDYCQEAGADRRRLSPTALPADTMEDQGSVELATLEWVAWFDIPRLLEPIGYITLVEVEAT